MVLKVAMAMRNGQQIEGRDEWLGQNERTLRGGPRRRLVSKRGPASATSRARPWNAPPALRGGPKRPLVLSIPCGAGPRGPMCLACQLEPRLSLRDEAFAIFFFFFFSLPPPQIKVFKLSVQRTDQCRSQISTPTPTPDGATDDARHARTRSLLVLSLNGRSTRMADDATARSLGRPAQAGLTSAAFAWPAAAA